MRNTVFNIFCIDFSCQQCIWVAGLGFAEEAYREVHPGWTIVKRAEGETIMVRGDQVDTLPVAEMYADYKASKKDGGDWFEAWMATQRAEAEARKRTLEQAKDLVIATLLGYTLARRTVPPLLRVGAASINDLRARLAMLAAYL